jgi:hypothetical protein
VWLGRRLAGRTVQVRLDGATMHVSLDGRLPKTLPCRLRPEDLGRGRLAGARPAGPAPASVAAHAVLLGPGDAVEVTRRVNAAGTVGIAGQQVSVGLPLAGQTVTLRLEAATMHVLADGALVVTIHVAERELRIFDEGGLIKVIPRRDRQEVTRFKAHKQHKPHGNNG